MIMKHVFKALKEGYKKEYDAVWFDADYYSIEEASSQFIERQKEVLKNNHWHDGKYYEYDGVNYHNYHYIGTYDDDNLPQSDMDVMDNKISESKRNKIV